VVITATVFGLRPIHIKKLLPLPVPQQEDAPAAGAETVTNFTGLGYIPRVMDEGLTRKNGLRFNREEPLLWRSTEVSPMEQGPQQGLKQSNHTTWFIWTAENVSELKAIVRRWHRPP